MLREVVHQCVVRVGHAVAYFLKSLFGCRRRCFGSHECVVVKEFKGLPSVVDGFLVGDRALRPGDPECGWWVVRVYVEVKLFAGGGVVVDVGEGVGW